VREKFAIRAQKRKIFKISAFFEKESYLLVSECKGRTNTGRSHQNLRQNEGGAPEKSGINGKTFE
jgi:hypothetical protein